MVVFTCIVLSALLLVSSAQEVQQDRKLIVVAMSGLRHDYVDQPGLPAFQSFKQYGTQAKQMEIPFITNSWPSLFTLSTGLWPEQHGIIDESMSDPTISGGFKVGSTKLDTLWAPYKPIWISAEETGIKTAVYGWPGSELSYSGVSASYKSAFVYSENKENAEQRIDEFLSKMIADAKLGFLLLPEPDNTGHVSGAESPETQAAVKTNDGHLSLLMSRLEQYDMINNTNVIVLGDHGMTNHDSDQVIYLSDYGVSYGDIEWFTGTMFTSGMLRPREDKSAQDIYDKLSTPKAKNVMTTYYKEELPEEFHIKYHRRTAPITVVPNLGYRIDMVRPHADIQFTHKTIGMHGYSNAEADMRPAFLAKGPDFKRVTVDTLRSVDVYPMICSLMQISTCHGTDGTITKPQELVKVTLTDSRPDPLDYENLNQGARLKVMAPVDGASAAVTSCVWSTLTLITVTLTLLKQYLM